MKVNNCRVKNPDVNGLSTQTTEETDQHSNMTTEENLEKKSSRYLYIVIPLIITFFVVCVGFVIWKRLHKRNRSEE
ncbi:hypothetical protein MS3_00010538 [Schistosoma haematobium]|uniref:Uncharacterized protein n=1 Tax=Schistosoma haematobium TaxID=6185 RepID=A0A922IHK4_SCHHA|nr:uncharacterized protein MS3_00010538 [Schistosoma haematobium]KAH9578557.1 hypothetical protein MS3_00010538 [Schistosoma haematobium]